MQNYIGRGVLVLSMSSHLLFGASDTTLFSSVRDFSAADNAAHEIMSEASFGWRGKFPVV